jgi:hypothetical protein
MFPLMFSPLFLLPVLIRNARIDSMPIAVFTAGFFAVILLFMLVLYPVSVLTQTSLTLGVLDVEQGAERLSIPELLKRSLPFFWRVLGLMLLFAAGVTLINLIMQGILILFTIVTLGMGTMCIAPLTLLIYPALYAAIVWMEQAMNGILIDNMTIMDAARQGWTLLRNNLLPVALMALIIYFGIGMITGVILVPLMIPLFLAPLSFMNQEVDWIILSISIASAVAFIPLFAILTGWSMIFTKSAWVLTYLRLRRGSGSQPLPVQVTA